MHGWKEKPEEKDRKIFTSENYENQTKPILSCHLAFLLYKTTKRGPSSSLIDKNNDAFDMTISLSNHNFLLFLSHITGKLQVSVCISKSENKQKKRRGGASSLLKSPVQVMFW